MTTYYAVNHEDVWLLDGSSTGNVIHLQLPCTARVTARECWLLLGQGDVEGAADKLSDMLELNDWDQRAADDPRFVFCMKVCCRAARYAHGGHGPGAGGPDAGHRRLTR